MQLTGLKVRLVICNFIIASIVLQVKYCRYPHKHLWQTKICSKIISTQKKMVWKGFSFRNC